MSIKPKLISVDAILRLHTEAILRWKAGQLELTAENFLSLVEENHAFNYRLWHAEDRARRDDKGLNLSTRLSGISIITISNAIIAWKPWMLG